MLSKNVETLRAAPESWNKRDFAGVVKNAAGVARFYRSPTTGQVTGIS